ncbi:hypothetical protein PHJA_000842600 [Phtheirospermum japonicum]|uniref:Uncharacterized protein n=1 Tax=Phtheirospermum japonicum TaxID=374723 RepID=A0A830BPT2_9LAMI|nr:hypothetical protein PHJA_000842600 [Phtheirospermum japonicum]
MQISLHPLHGVCGGDPHREPHLGCVVQGDASAHGGAGPRPRNVLRRHLLAQRRKHPSIPGPVPPPPAP